MYLDEKKKESQERERERVLDVFYVHNWIYSKMSNLARTLYLFPLFLASHHLLCLKITVSRGCTTNSINTGEIGYQPVCPILSVAAPSIRS